MSDLSKMSDAEFAASLTKKACGCAGVGDHDLMEHLNEAARRLTAAGERNDTEWFRRRSESYAPLSEFKIVCDQRDAARAEVERLREMFDARGEVCTAVRAGISAMQDDNIRDAKVAEAETYAALNRLMALEKRHAALSPAPAVGMPAMTPEQLEAQRQNFASGNLAIDRQPDSRRTVYPAPPAAEREAVRVLGEEVGAWRSLKVVNPISLIDAPIIRAKKNTDHNPIAAAAVKEALAAKPIAGSTVAGLVIGEKAEQTPGDPKGTP